VHDPGVTDARSAAATLRWHVLVATAAIIATVVPARG
jgi:hypothetical protein